jgi:hypothetical protein
MLLKLNLHNIDVDPSMLIKMIKQIIKIKGLNKSELRSEIINEYLLQNKLL